MITQSQATMVANGLDAVWPRLDPQGRSFRAALRDSLLRGRAQAWPAGDKTAYADVQAHAIGTQLYVELLQGRAEDPYSDRWASALARTNRMLAERAGYKGQSVDQITAENRNTANIGVILAVVTVIAAVIVYVVVAYYLITNAAQVVDNELSRNAEERQLVKSQSEAERIIGQHLDAEQKAGHPIEWSDAELSYLTALEQNQASLIGGLAKTQRPLVEDWWATPWPYVGIVGAAGVAIAVVYRDEIKRWFNARFA